MTTHIYDAISEQEATPMSDGYQDLIALAVVLVLGGALALWLHVVNRP